MERELGLVLVAAASVGLIRALAGPDHYLPFVVLGRARGWSLARTLRVTLACGTGHVLASVALGGLGIAFGWSLGSLEALESARGDLAAWLLLGFGLAYTAWGVRQAARDRPHSHWHAHADGTVHEHRHVHRGQHAHPHEAGAGRRLTPWLLFVVLVLGPCEALIPLLMVPAAHGSWTGVGLVALVFALVTVATMLAAVAAGSLGLARIDLRPVERYAHALAGLTVAVCGVAVWLGL